MCIMFVRRKDQTLSPDLVAGMYCKGNRDGAGVMFIDEQGQLVIDKCLGSENDVRAFYEKYNGRDIAFHLRHQSVGKINLEMCHPYIVTSTELGHPRTIAMMHNGTIKDIQVDKDWSDSRNLATFFLRDLLAEDPDLLDSVAFTRYTAGLIGKSKLIFLDDRGKFTVVNSGLGAIMTCGAWVSTCDTINPMPPMKSYKPTTGFHPLSNISPKQPALAGTWAEGDDGKKRFRRNDDEPVVLQLPGRVNTSSLGISEPQLVTVNQLCVEADEAFNIGAM